MPGGDDLNRFIFQQGFQLFCCIFRHDLIKGCFYEQYRLINQRGIGNGIVMIAGDGTLVKDIVYRVDIFPDPFNGVASETFDAVRFVETAVGIAVFIKIFSHCLGV